ncbi:Flagellar hook protein [Oleispira antarctica RB-8]|uniref:Flagellar hook protein FlgE n=1 Tax=Oleispira antarctica RB-8 TaxID=698738 RepID=R4YLG1_OLEAN|nr:Flagellar hook protein [Oleispira antarctica RB-8]
MSFNIGLSGIRAASTDLEVTGNNVANASTTGFKESRAEFSDVYTSTLLGTGSKPVGSGVMVENVRQQFSQGNISGTENALDMAIDGNGFFVLEDRGTVSYTRAGLFGLDKDGYVVANNNARVQGFDANAEGVVSGVLGDLQIQVGNQSPALTSRVSAILNLDASEEVLQEQGLELVANGLSVGVADSGIIDSTSSTLVAAGQPTTAGIPAQVTFGNTVSAMVTTPPGPTSVTIDLNDGSPAITFTLDIAAEAPTTNQELIDYIQGQINTELGSQQITVQESVPGGFLELVRAGYSSTNGTNFTVTPAGTFGGTTPTNGTSGSQLFVGSTPITADFRSIPGTSTTTRTTSTPPLGIVAFNGGTAAELTADSALPPLAALDLSGGNSLVFDVFVEGQPDVTITLDGTNPNTAPTLVEVRDEINSQLGASAVASISGNRLVFTVGAPAVNGDSIQIADTNTTSLNLSDLGFTTTFRNDGVEEVQANNQFNLQVTSTTGSGTLPRQITIPPNNYASLDDLAVAIQQQIAGDLGATGLNGKVTVAAVGGQLVFTNTNTGASEGIDITATAGAPFAEAALGFNSLFAVTGQDEIDKTNSFRLNLTVPAPDSDNRSGSVLISLDEEYRSVQQLATSINRQLNSQNGDDYIGIRAQAVEISPKVVPPQFTLELLAVEEGEASIISISNVSASGEDISSEQLFAILQANPSDSSLLTTGIEGVNNQYPEQQVTIVDPEGNETNVTIPEGTEANAIASIFNQQPGLTATANTVMTIPLSSYNNPSNLMSLTVNGQALTSSTLPEIAEEINGYRGTTLPGFLATISETGDLVITNEIGRDVKLEMSSASPTDSLLVMGAENTGPVVLGGTATAASAAAVGGHVTFTLNEGYTMESPQPSVSGLFGALTADEFTPTVLNAFDPTDQNTYNHATSTEMFDSLGNSHVMTQYFVKEPLDPSRPNEQNIWAMYVQVDEQDVGDPDSTLNFPENLVPTRARYELFFNQDGTLDNEATGDIYITNWDPKDANGDSSGAVNSVNVLEGGLPLTTPPTNSNFQITLEGSTQFGSSFSVSEKNQDGYSTGRLAGLEVDQEGMIFARYTNGQAQVLGQVALANFRNPEGLTPLGDTGWAESFESGVGTVGSPRTASFGQVRSSALEDSNVDISEELVGLIIAQRNFQASAKTIETMDQVTQTILNI